MKPTKYTTQFSKGAWCEIELGGHVQKWGWALVISKSDRQLTASTFRFDTPEEARENAKQFYIENYHYTGE